MDDDVTTGDTGRYPPAGDTIPLGSGRDAATYPGGARPAGPASGPSDEAGRGYGDYGYAGPSADAVREDRPRQRGFWAAVLVAFLISLIVAAFAGAIAGFAGAWIALSRGSTPIAGPGGTIRVTGTTNEPVAAAAAAALPAVVNIDVSGNGSASAGQDGLPKGHPTVPMQGNGSGVAYKKAPGGGTYIITNNHVIEGADSIMVTPVRGERVKASLVGTDPDTDIAVVKVETAIPVVQVGDSKNLHVGDMAVAIGSPFGLEHSVTSGVISAVHRSLPPSSGDTSATASLVDVIQTDAAINPGNSGGALVDRQGKLIGINSAIFSQSGSNDGIGFAIPSVSAVRVANELIDTGKVRHPFLGVIGQTITEQVAKQKGLPINDGALVLDVVKESGAAKAGLKQDDVIVQLDDKKIRSMEELIAAVRDAGVGTTVTLKVYRDKAPITLKMTVGVKPPNI
jgi:S1-C subfamily serine protease